MQRQKLAYLTARSLRQAWPLEQVLRQAANSNQPTRAQLAGTVAGDSENA
jgi:hypothetical protein